MEELLTLPGVGRKTANLVLILAFKSLKNICVDTHVHRISNRLGWVTTRTPDETEQALYASTDQTLVAVHQSVSGDLGTERLPPALSALRRLRDQRVLSARGRDAGVDRPRRRRSRCDDSSRVAARHSCAVAVCGRRRRGCRHRPPTRRSSSSRRRRGTFAFETYPAEAPKTVAHVVALVKRGFYDGQRFHRALPGFVIQWGDPQSRDESTEAQWGRGAAASSGTPIGAAELAKKRTHTKGAVGMAHPGDPALGRQPDLRDAGESRRSQREVHRLRPHRRRARTSPSMIQRGDVIRRMYVKE